MIGIGITPYTGQLSLQSQALSVLRSFGSNAHAFVPGIGVVSGLIAGNYLDSAGVTSATVDNPIGLAKDPFGTINTTQTVTGNKPIERYANGHYYAQFNGSTNYLSLSAVPFQATDDYAIVGSTLPTAAGTIYSQHASGTGLIKVSFDASGHLVATWEDDAGVTVTYTSTTAYLGTAIEFAVRKVGTAVTVWENNVLKYTGSVSTLGTVTLTAASIGATGMTPASFMTGNIYDLFPVKGTFSGSQLKTVNRYSGIFAGVSV
jgi:hypothetical protein